MIRVNALPTDSICCRIFVTGSEFKVIWLRNDGFYLRVPCAELFTVKNREGQRNSGKNSCKVFWEKGDQQVIEVCKTALDLDVLDKRRGTHPVAIFLSIFSIGSVAG